MAMSSLKLEQIVLEALANGDVAPVLAVGGSSMNPALIAANAVQSSMLRGGPVVQSMGWKWNRFYPTPFATNSFQQDYASNCLTIGWLERCQAIDVNNTSQPKPCIDVFAKRDLVPTYRQFFGPVNISWLYNNLLMYGTWGGTALSQQFGLTQPGPNVVYTNPIGITLTPSNPITQLMDPNGNYWVLTQYGVCGNSQPLWPLAPVFPTLAAPNAVATVVTDGSVNWTAINPTAQGFRISPIPPQTGRTWEIYPIAQAKPIQYAGLESFLSPIPDEMVYPYFSDGFMAYLYMKSNDPKLRAKGADNWARWQQSLDNCVRSGNVEPDDFRFLPESAIMSPSGDSWGGPRPDYPLSGAGLPGAGWY